MSRSLFRQLGACCAALMFAALPTLGHAQMPFPSADAAADAFVDAVARSDDEALRRVLGANYKKVLKLGEVAHDDKLNFLEAWAKTHRVVPLGSDVAVLEVGDSNWTLPVPMVRKGDAWVFDTRAGADEMTTRRIGRNELSAMEAALAYFDAQKEYAGAERQAGQGRVYAQKFRSSPGKKDGLYWDTDAAGGPSPLGPGFEATSPDGAYHGYHFRILTAQGKNAPGGAYDYRSKGRMNAGFALIAWPAKWGDTGIMSFMVSHDGVLYQKNLGANGSAVARGMQRFDPDDSWQSVQAPSQLAAGREGGRHTTQRAAAVATRSARPERRPAMQTLPLNALWTLLVALLTIGLGAWVSARVTLLTIYSIPPAVIGGLLVAVVLLVLQQFDWRTGFASQARGALLLIFFTTLGLGAIPVGLSVMQRLALQNGAAPRAFVVVTLAASLVRDRINAGVVQDALSWTAP